MATQDGPNKARALLNKALDQLSFVTSRFEGGPKDSTAFDESTLPALEKLQDTLDQLNDVLSPSERNLSLRGKRVGRLFESNPDAADVIRYLAVVRLTSQEQIACEAGLSLGSVEESVRALKKAGFVERVRTRDSLVSINELGLLLDERLRSAKPSLQEIADSVSALELQFLRAVVLFDRDGSGVTRSRLAEELGKSIKNLGPRLRRVGVVSARVVQKKLKYFSTELGREILKIIDEGSGEGTTASRQGTKTPGSG